MDRKVKVVVSIPGQDDKISWVTDKSGKREMLNEKSFRISDIKRAKEFLNSVNDVPLKDVTFLGDDGEPIEIDEKLIDEFKFIGLNNSDFILTGFYKDGYDSDSTKV